MLYFLLAALGLLAIHQAKPVASAASSGLPWSPPVTIAPVLKKSRDTSVTKFPVDVWVWSVPGATTVRTYVLAVASDDRSSFVGYMVATNGQKILAAKGSGPLTAQIQNQV